jgi:hypothetical protein
VILRSRSLRLVPSNSVTEDWALVWVQEDGLALPLRFPVHALFDAPHVIRGSNVVSHLE